MGQTAGLLHLKTFGGLSVASNGVPVSGAAQAAELYGGPFLDGFYLSDAAEFERWVEAERRRLRERAAAALERLATQAAAGGDQRGAVAWWRRLAALDPLNSHVALGLMKGLAAAGDRAGALQAARVHESLLREAVGVALDAAVADLTERLRAEAERSPGPRRLAAPERADTEAVPPGGDPAAEPGALARKRGGFARAGVV